MRARSRVAASPAPIALLTVAVGLGYLLVTAWAMANVSYDVWGALIAIPLIAAMALPLVRYVFRGESRTILNIALLG
ncbi:MAG: hypothetical protein LH616_18390, partial [Ilumatobacteraceae bacterium]|nr:hypothetical protein [Ilumatobacteraceae bacterium]